MSFASDKADIPKPAKTFYCKNDSCQEYDPIIHTYLGPRSGWLEGEKLKFCPQCGTIYLYYACNDSWSSLTIDEDREFI